MTFKAFTIVLLLAAVCFHHNALAFPATVNPAPTPEATPGSSNALIADANLSGALGSTNLASTEHGQNDKNTAVSLASTAELGGKNGKSKAAGLSTSELAEVCAPLIAEQTGKTNSLGGKGETLGKSEPGGGKGSKIESAKEQGAKNTTTTVGKTPPKKSSASVFIRSSVVTSAMPMLLSTGVGLLIL